MSAATAQTFNTIQFCINNTVPCFTFSMDYTKKPGDTKWKEITSANFINYLNQKHNGFAIITGDKYIVLDIDNKHSPSQTIIDFLHANCDAVEQTPGGFHYWFKTHERTSHFTNTTDAYWDNQQIKGLDIRAKGGICYCAPTNYIGADGSVKRYKWIKGNLSKATEVPSEILEHISYSPMTPTTIESRQQGSTFSFVIPQDTTDSISESAHDPDETMTILNGLAPTRADNYDSWLKIGMALKNEGYPLEVWDTWSRRSSKYEAGICQQKWKSFNSREQNKITMATIYHWLKEDNYPLFISIKSANDQVLEVLFEPTNAGIADLFYELNPNRYLFNPNEGWFILQENNTWIATGSNDILSIPDIYNSIRIECNNLLSKLLQKINTSKDPNQATKTRQIGEAIKKISTSSFIKGVLSFLPGKYLNMEIDKLFNEKRELFAFTNGVLDMTTELFRTIEPTDYISVTCDYEYREAKAEEKQFVEDFLTAIFPSRPVLDYMLASLATCLEGYNRSETFHALTGVGSNGKSFLMDLCKVVLGNYFRTIPISYFTKDDEGKDKPLPDLVSARYARMLVASEPEEKDKLMVAFLKIITGNDEISCRGMYGKTVIKYIPQFKIFIMTNDMPKLSKYDQGIERRMRCVHFPTRFVHNPRNENERYRDDTLKDKIKTDPVWRYGLLGLLIDASKTMKGKKLEMPQEVQEFTDAYMLENNPVGAWLREHYELTGHREDIVQKTELYNTFLEESGVNKSHKVFKEDLIKCNVLEKTLKGMHYYFGLRRKE
jgi:P4 family phage/plasmid primase-like protien